jgi:multidrug efflux pump subunit AcrA (membrane-fusion protein)
MVMKPPQWKTMLILLVSGAVLITGCSTAQPTEAPADSEQDQPVAQDTGGAVSATGEVAPDQWTTLSFPVSGQAVEVLVEEGMQVEEGDLLAQLDSTDLDLALASAEAALGVAEANLDLAEAGPREEEVERAEDQLAAANARVSVAAAERERLREAPDQNAVIDAQTRVQEAANSAADLQESHDALINFATEHWDEFDFEPGDRTPLDGEQNLRFALELANLQLAAAQAQLNDLLDGPDPDDMRVADAKVWVAAAQREAAQAYLDLVMAGPAPVDIAVAEAEVEQAQAAVESARAALDQTRIEAPFSGTVTTLHIDQGEWVGTGQPVLVLADLSTLQVETTDLNELDVARIAVGDAAIITFDALPDVELDGTVVSIAPKSTEGAGVNYTVTIELSDAPAALRWGMTAFIDIQAE